VKRLREAPLTDIAAIIGASRASLLFTALHPDTTSPSAD
jgi:hypothetical protein